MLRNIEQIQLEKISEKLNSSAFRQSKEKVKDIKLKFTISSKKYFCLDPLGQLTCLSSRDSIFRDDYGESIK
jgi:hypothetical protein